MTSNNKSLEIITHSDLNNWMHTMMTLRAMKLQASAEVPEVRSMTAMANRKVGSESLEICGTNFISVKPMATS